METALLESPSAVGAEVLARLESAWNAGDGKAFGAEYAQDASFVTIRGEHIVGAAAIAAGHAGIFASTYLGSVNRMRVVDARRLSDDVIVVVSRSTLDCPCGPLTGIHDAMATNVLTRGHDGVGTWTVTFTHNTLVTV